MNIQTFENQHAVGGHFPFPDQEQMSSDGQPTGHVITQNDGGSAKQKNCPATHFGSREPSREKARCTAAKNAKERSPNIPYEDVMARWKSEKKVKRTAKQLQHLKPVNNFYFLSIVSLFVFEYSCYTISIFPSLLLAETGNFLLNVFCAFFFQFNVAMLVFSFIQASCSNAGSVPRKWGLYQGDHLKRRRYCKICDVWKPDRTHHCSVCGRCVLNMDHHCPWIKNCIGFNNRKFFILLLIYTNVCLGFIIVHTMLYIYFRGSSFGPCINPYILEWREMCECLQDLLTFAGCISSLLVAVGLAFPVACFTKFHLTIALWNSTTIEYLELGGHVTRNKYDMGKFRNIAQVMGTNICFWWIPIHTIKHRPLGNGVEWNVKSDVVYDRY